MTTSRPPDNRSRLVRTVVAGRIAPARCHAEASAVDREGRSYWLPATGGIALGVHAGDAVDSLLGDHLMPGASVEDAEGDAASAGPLHLFASVGNILRDAQGRPIGLVAGKRGGLAPGFWAPQLVGVEMADAVMDRMAPGDRVLLEAEGRGLTLVDHPDLTVTNLAPRTLDVLPLREGSSGLICAVTAIVPSDVAGAGLGQDSWIGDLEIAGNRTVAGSLAGLRFGDLVAFADLDARTARFYRPDHLAIGVVSHGPSPAPGHGVGVTMVLSGPSASLGAVVEAGAGIGDWLRGWAQDLLAC